MKWDNILLAEFGFTALALLMLGFIKLPRFLFARKLAPGSPWGYYADQVPQEGYLQDPKNRADFLHDTGAEFGGPEGFGDYGEFTGFGELGEFGSSFYGGHE
jgi:hypothetical protein